jgi:urea transport system permease protein
VRTLRRALGVAVLWLATGAGAAIATPLTPEAQQAVTTELCSGPAGQVAALARITEAGAQTGGDGDAAGRRWATDLLASLRGGAFVCPGADGPMVPSIVMQRLLATAVAQLELFSPDVAQRRTAAAQIDRNFRGLNPALVNRALAQETDADVKQALVLALAKRGLGSDDVAEQQRALAVIAEAPSEASRTLLANFLETGGDALNPNVAASARAALRSVDRWLQLGHWASVLFSGLSYAGVLLITALGLSIVFGLLGVINLAHGEFIMIGAYATYLVEQLLQAHAPGLFDAYIFIAIPVAFIVCALCGMLLEVCVIRHLYHRPLETLLATWAVSIALVKAVQLGFGPQNVEFVTPSFLNGGVQVFAGFFVTYNRLFAIALALSIFAATYALIRRTRFGLLVRATTQRRDTARSLGVSAERIDRLAFGLGAGLAGLAGVVLTQIASVNPSMGTSFVIDAFMVVVLGGAGSLVGTAVASLALGEINQFIEPLYGAVTAKVAVLVLIVLIIQRRPQGLFALKTRT